MRGQANPTGQYKRIQREQMDQQPRPRQFKEPIPIPAPAMREWVGTITLNVRVSNAPDCETAHQKVAQLLQALPGERMTGVCFETPLVVLKVL